jgi:hypothetical protein
VAQSLWLSLLIVQNPRDEAGLESAASRANCSIGELPLEELTSYPIRKSFFKRIQSLIHLSKSRIDSRYVMKSNVALFGKLLQVGNDLLCLLPIA